MTRPVFVHMLPQLVDPQALAGSTAVMIDILRASTTIVHALACGAEAIIPCETVAQARKLQAHMSQSTTASGGEPALLGGERHGLRIPGFDLDNSPFSYSADVVAGRTIVFTTTNGTRALAACRFAERVLIGAFVNRSGLLNALRKDVRPVHLVCAGTEGCLTAEDILFAGAIAADLVEPDAAALLDVQTQMAIDFSTTRSASPQTLCETLRTSRGGQNLIRLGMDADIDRAAQCDLFDLVPQWHPADNRIVPVSP